MEANLNKVINIRISNTVDALKKNNFNALYVPSSEAAVALVKSMLKDGETTASGGSVTLNQTGILSLIKNAPYNYIDRYEKGITSEEKQNRQNKALTCDSFFMSTNAITENGCLYNVDGTGNRVSALTYGPKRVFVIAGYNKIVTNLTDAVERVKNIACPANCVRLDIDTPCMKTGHCVKKTCDSFSLMSLESRGECPHICNHAVVTMGQNNKDRITVIIVGEELGY